MRRIWLIPILLAGLFLPLPALAESIPSFKTEITIDQAGQARFIEKIDYILDSGKHGIYRDIPVVGSLSNNKYLYYNFSQPSVMRGGQTETFTSTSNGIYQRLKIGDPNKTISGLQNYQVEFSLSPFVRHDPAGDYITINLTGNEWEEQLQQASGVVNLPADMKILSTECFTGPVGSTAHDCKIENTDNHISVTSDNSLSTGEGMTVDIVVPANSFSSEAYLEPSDTPPTTTQSNNGWSVIAIFIIVTLSGLISIVAFFWYLRSLYIKSKKRKQQTIIPQYDPPDGLSPGEVGLLSDDIATTVEITAILIQLAIRGHLKISYEEQKQLFGKKQRFLLTSQTSKDKLQDYEEILLNGIFSERSSGTDQAVYIDKLSQTTMSTVVTHVKKILAMKLKAKGYFLEKINWAEHTTESGYTEWAKVEGLKLYLSVAEKDRIKFAEAPDKTPERFTKLLPYAIALGVEKDWAKQFEGIDISPAASGWYSGSSMNNAVLFTGLMSNSFASSVSSNFSPPSSSGGSGGGSSGGGGGGGGGGSW